MNHIADAGKTIEKKLEQKNANQLQGELFLFDEPEEKKSEPDDWPHKPILLW